VKGVNPTFEQEFSIPLSNGTTFVEIKVKHKGLIGRKLLGVARIALVEIAGVGTQGLRRWFPLLTAEGQFEVGDVGFGEVCHCESSCLFPFTHSLDLTGRTYSEMGLRRALQIKFYGLRKTIG
jgi:hypothetical protein